MVIVDDNYDTWSEDEQRHFLQSCLSRARQEEVRKIITLGKKGDAASQPIIGRLARYMRMEDGIAAIPIAKGRSKRTAMKNAVSYIRQADFSVGKFIICAEKDLVPRHMTNTMRFTDTLIKELIGVGFDQNVPAPVL